MGTSERTDTCNEGDTYRQWLCACLEASIPAITTDTAARIMAILYEYGNNEGFTYNQKFLAEKDYIQERFNLRAMGVVEPKFQELLKGYVKELQEYQEAHKDEATDGSPIAPQWAPHLLKERYNMNFIG